MAKRGRPREKKRWERRIHSISLSEKGERLFQRVKEKNRSFDFSKYVDMKLIRDFEDKEQWTNNQLIQAQKDRDKIEERIQELAEELGRIKNNKGERGLCIQQNTNYIGVALTAER